MFLCTRLLGNILLLNFFCSITVFCMSYANCSVWEELFVWVFFLTCFKAIGGGEGVKI